MAMKPHGPDNGMKFLGVLLIIFGTLVALTSAKGATVAPHHFDPKFSLVFAADWNVKHPKWPILDMACAKFPAEKLAGGPRIPVHEDCVFVERITGQHPPIQCGEVTIKATYDHANPDAALIVGQPLTCAEARKTMASIRTEANAQTA